MIKSKGLSQKVFLFTTTLIILIIAAVLGILYFLLPGYYLRQKSEVLGKRADSLEKGLNAAETSEACAALIYEFAETNNSVVIALDSDGMLLPELSSVFLSISRPERLDIIVRHIEEGYGESVSLASDAARIALPAQGRTPETFSRVRIIDSNNNDTFFISQNISSAVITKTITNGIIGRINISSTLQPIDEAKGVIISLMPYLLMIAFIIALAASYLFARQLTKPILKISGAAAKMLDMQPDILSGIRTEDELGLLSRNLDSLYMKLCDNIKNLRLEMDKVTKLETERIDFMRSAGHELKTPIATLNGMIEGMLDNVGAYKNREKYLAECREQLAGLAKLVNEILMATQLERENQLSFEDTDIYGAVAEVVGMYEVQIKNARLKLELESFRFSFNTDRHILHSTLSNLISNAVSYTASNGKIIISFTQNENGGVLSVENQCENIEDDMLPKLFEPFFTLNYSRNRAQSGTGLGLYIIKKNLDLIGLSHEIANTPLGIKFSIIFGENQSE